MWLCVTICRGTYRRSWLMFTPPVVASSLSRGGVLPLFARSLSQSLWKQRRPICEPLVVSEHWKKATQWRLPWQLMQRRGHASETWDDNAQKIKVKFAKEGVVKEVHAALGASVLEVAHHTDVDLEGACEGSLACSTCHVICEGKIFDALPTATDKEEDMLDLAPCLTSTSRLGCQVVVTEDMEGTTFTLPASTVNFYVDGHVPKPH